VFCAALVAVPVADLLVLGVIVLVEDVEVAKVVGVVGAGLFTAGLLGLDELDEFDVSAVVDESLLVAETPSVVRVNSL
jgi:hypothetical protein